MAAARREALAAGDDGRVVACSALRRAYRDAIRAACPDAAFVELVVPAEDLGERIADRPGHFMPPSLLASQLEALEPLADDEAGVRIENVGARRRGRDARDRGPANRAGRLSPWSSAFARQAGNFGEGGPGHPRERAAGHP